MSLLDNIALVKLPEVSYDQQIVQRGVDEAFQLLGYDIENFGKDNWNPLKKIIHPGDHILLKPNMVLHKNNNPTGGVICLYTQPAVVAAVLKYVVRACDSKGAITIADAPMQACDWDVLIQESGYADMVARFQRENPTIKFSLKDLRGVKSIVKNGFYRYHKNEDVDEIMVRLDEQSSFWGLPEERIRAMRVTDYDPDILTSYHTKEQHIYSIAKEVLDADVFINIPKPKTHRKAGITCALKNIVGTVTRKECLPHHTNGHKTAEDVSRGGDAYLSPNIFRRVEDWMLDYRNRFAQTRGNVSGAWLFQQCLRVNRFLARKVGMEEKYSEGSWYGNTTISKTITDLNKILFYADKDGVMSTGLKPVRKYLIVADMIVAGDHDGPLAPTPNPLGIIGVGENPVQFDEVIATLYGARMEYMHTINEARNSAKSLHPLVLMNQEGRICSNNLMWNGKTWRELSTGDKLQIVSPTSWNKAFYTPMLK